MKSLLNGVTQLNVAVVAGPVRRATKASSVPLVLVRPRVPKLAEPPMRPPTYTTPFWPRARAVAASSAAPPARTAHSQALATRLYLPTNASVPPALASVVAPNVAVPSKLPAT